MLCSFSSKHIQDLGLQSEDLASQRERGSGFSVNDVACEDEISFSFGFSTMVVIRPPFSKWNGMNGSAG